MAGGYVRSATLQLPTLQRWSTKCCSSWHCTTAPNITVMARRSRHYNDGRQLAALRRSSVAYNTMAMANNALQLAKLWRWPTTHSSSQCCGDDRLCVATCGVTAMWRWPTVRCSSQRYNDATMASSALQRWPTAQRGKTIFLFFLLSSFKTASSCVSTQERNKEIKKEKKKGGGSLKPALLVSKNVTTQAPSNNTNSNTNNNLRCLQ